jgi:hypothetical protein
MVSFLAETARDAVYRENHDIFSGYKYLATLDTRTCLVCGRDDGRVFKTLEEAPKLPRHHNCRCLYVPYLKGFEDIPGERAAMDGPVSDKLTYQDWLAQQDPAVQKDILGPARFAAYQAGVPVSSFVSDGRTLTLEQLRATHGDKVPPKYAYKAVDADTEQGMQDAAYQVYAAATPESQEALKAYTRNGFSDMNNMLYGNTSYDDIIDKEVKNLDTIIKDYKLDQHIITYRGTESGYYAGWKAGSSYTLPAFVSTSIDKDNEILGDDFRMELRIKKGTTGMYIGDLSRHKTEREFLLGRGLTYKVVKKTKNTMIVEVSND